MSVQLIVYPQALVSTTTSTTTNTGFGPELIYDGQIFSTLNNATATSAEGADNIPYYSSLLTQFNIQPPTIPNTWYRWRNVSTAHSPNYLAYPTQSGGDVDFESEGIQNTSGSYPFPAGYENNWSMIYQRITGLVIGQTYRITIKFDSITVADKARGIYGVVSQTGSGSIPHVSPYGTGTPYITCTGSGPQTCYLNGTDVELEFTSPETELIFVLKLVSLDGSGEPTLTVKSVSIKSSPTTTTTTTTGFSTDLAGQEILDLYEEETIPLTLSVDDFKDVATKTQSYSKAFNLPATKKNNKVFGSIYEVTKKSDVYTFNPYISTAVTLKENGFMVFEGFLRLIDVVDKNGEISYNVNLYSDTVALMDSMKDKTFSELPLSELDHEYNITSIQESQTGALPLLSPLPAGTFAGVAGADTTDVLKYPLVDWAGSMNRNATSVHTALGATDGNPSMNKLEDGFRPFIQLKYLVDNIFADSGFTYTSDFLTSTYFSKLFMDFNWGEERNGSAPNRNDFLKRKTDTVNTIIANGSYTTVPLTQLGSPPGSPDLWDSTNYRFQSDVNNLTVTGVFNIQIENRAWISPGVPNVDSWSAAMRIAIFNAGGSVIETIKYEKRNDDHADGKIPPGGGASLSGSFDVVLNNGDYIALQAITWNSDHDILVSDTTTSYLNVTYNNTAVSVLSLLQVARGELGQWDFFKGLITMFNLITLKDAQDPSNLIIEPYNDVFVTNPNIKTIDWTHKVDISDIKLKPFDLHKRTLFKYEEDEEDYPFSVYKTATGGYLYGSKDFDASGFDLLKEETEIVASPFAATLIKPLFDDIADFYASVIYGANEDATEFGSIKNLPRILYDTGVHTINDSYYIPAQNGGGDDNATTYSLFSHTSAVPSTLTDTDLNFGECQLMIGVSPTDNLFSTYYFQYFSELYSADVKTMTLKVLLTPEDVSNFNFYDKVFIKNREYRVDKINYKPNDLATIDFILIT
jgi:hypothetical protein